MTTKTSTDTTASKKPTKRSLPHRLFRFVVRAAAALVLLLVVLLAAGFVWEQTATRGFASKYPAPGQLVTLPDGRAMHFVAKGKGQPTLVLEAGAGGPHSDWETVFDELAKTTRVVAYDRAGYGWSDPSPETNSELIIADLHDGLAALGESGPMVLVGHSIGGVYVRHYASVYPDGVAGLVLVDSSHEEQMDRMPSPIVETMQTQISLMRAVGVASRFGLLRALTLFGAHPMVSEGMSDARKAQLSRSTTIRAAVQEMQSFKTSVKQAQDASALAGALPILVLSATKPPDRIPPAFAEHVDDMQAMWRELQIELAQLSTNSRHVFVPDASHYIQYSRPDVVIDEIRSMIEAIRAETPLNEVVESRTNALSFDTPANRKVEAPAMRVAALYDIHGNLPALEAVLEDIQHERVDAIVVGGDVYPGPMCEEAMDRLLEIETPVHFVTGNGDRETLALARGERAYGVPDSYLPAMRWGAERLTAGRRSTMQTWPKTLRIDIAGLGEALFCHATPRSDTEIFTHQTPEHELLDVFDGVDAPIVVCGHTHMQFDRMIGDVRVLNAGSVGMPFGEPGAYWLLLGPGIEFRRTMYNLDAAAELFRATTYPKRDEAADAVTHPKTEQEMLAVFSRSE